RHRVHPRPAPPLARGDPGMKLPVRPDAKTSEENAKTRKGESAKGTGMGGDVTGPTSPDSVGFRAFVLSRFRVLSGSFRAFGLVALLATLLSIPSGAAARKTVTIGSKAFPESWILGEALASLARQTGRVDVAHRGNLGGTEIVYKALLIGSVDVYPEYTGTVAQVLMKSSGRPSMAEMRAFL